MNIGSTSGSVFTSATYAIDQGISQARRAAQDVVDATTPRPVEGVGEAASAMTDLKRAEHLVAAGGKLMQAADEQVGTLIDTKA